MKKELETFIDAWTLAGGHDSPAIRLRVEQAASLAWVASEPWRLRAVLLAVLATSAAERELVARIYEEVFERSGTKTTAPLRVAPFATTDTGGPSGSFQGVGSGRDKRGRRTRGKTVLWVTILAGVIGGLSVATWFALEVAAVKDISRAQRHDSVVRTGEAPPVPGAGSSLNAGAKVDAAAGGASREHGQAPTRLRDVPKTKQLWGFSEGWWTTTGVGLGFVGLLWVAAGVRRASTILRRLKLRRTAVCYGPAKGVDLEHAGGSPVQPLTRTEAANIALALPSLVDQTRTVLDVCASIEATARSGIPQMVHHCSTRAARILLLTPVKLDPIGERLVVAASDALTRWGIDVTRSAERQAVVGQDAVLLIGETSRLPKSVVMWGRNQRNLAVVEASDERVRGWAPSAWSRTVFPLTGEGLRSALSHALQPRSARPRVEHAVLGEMRRLGAALPLAVGAALVQPLDLSVLDELRRLVVPRLPFIALQRLTRHPDVRFTVEYLEFNPAFLKRLLPFSGAGEVVAVLRFQIHRRLGLLRPALGTRAHAMKEREVALATLGLARWGEARAGDERAVAEAIETLEVQAEHGMLRTQVVARIHELGLGSPQIRGGYRLPLRRRHERRLVRLGRVLPSIAREKTLFGVAAGGAIAFLLASALTFARPERCPEGYAICGTSCRDVTLPCACEGCSGRKGTCCDGACVDISSDLGNCGSCGNECAEGAECIGFCSCLGGASHCGQECVDRRSDPRHCGACFRACRDGERCQDGDCQSGQSGQKVRDSEDDPTRPSGGSAAPRKIAARGSEIRDQGGKETVETTESDGDASPGATATSSAARGERARRVGWLRMRPAVLSSADVAKDRETQMHVQSRAFEHRSSFEKCFDKILETDPSFEGGSIEIEFRLREDGSVGEILRVEVPRGSMRECVVGALRQIAFDCPRSTTTPFTFTWFHMTMALSRGAR